MITPAGFPAARAKPDGIDVLSFSGGKAGNYARRAAVYGGFE